MVMKQGNEATTSKILTDEFDTFLTEAEAFSRSQMSEHHCQLFQLDNMSR